MKDVASAKTRENEAFWDVFVLKANGDWAGLRAPWKALRKVATLLALLLLLAGLGLTGWLLSRWQAGRLDRELAFERLKSSALEAELGALRAQAPGAAPVTATPNANGPSVSFLPNLDAAELESTFLKIGDTKSAYDAKAAEYQVEFTLTRQGPREGRPRSYTWIALLHGPQGVLIFPPVLRSRAGEVLPFERGQILEDFKAKKTVTARFKVKDFFEPGAAVGPSYTTILVYDGGSGSPLLRKRVELSFSPAGERAKP